MPCGPPAEDDVKPQPCTGEEGGEAPSFARVLFELRLLPDGRLSLSRDRSEPRLLLRRPPGIRVR